MTLDESTLITTARRLLANTAPDKESGAAQSREEGRLITNLLNALETHHIPHAWLLGACVFVLGDRAYAVTQFNSALRIQSGKTNVEET
jgi:hypothetical protein